MRLFFKHVGRSICRSPWQPILICITVALSVALAVTALCTSELFVAHAEQILESDRECGDILITLRSDNKERVLFDEEASALLGGDGQLLGEFSLTGFLEGGDRDKALRVSAVDLVAADRFYLFDYLDYGRFTVENLDRSAVISQSLAEREGLAVGDRFTLRLLERECIYTVQAIASDTGLLSQSDLLISHGGIVEQLLLRIPAAASLGDAFTPYTRLMIRLHDTTDAEAVMERLLTSPELADKNLQLTLGQSNADFWMLLQITIVFVFLATLLLLAGFLIGTSLSLLHGRRRSEYHLFKIAGASPRQIGLLVYLESGVYAVIGAVLGVILSAGLVPAAAAFYSWQTAPVSLGVWEALLGALLALLLMLGCTALHLRRRESDMAETQGFLEGGVARDRLSLLRWLLPGGLFVLCLLLAFLLPTVWAFYPAVIGIFLLLLLLYTVTAQAIRGIARLIERAPARTAAPRGWLLLPFKNICNHFSLRHLGRLVAVLLALVCAISTCRQVMQEQLDLMTSGVSIDILAYGASDQCKAKLAADPAVTETLQASYATAVRLGGTRAVAFSAQGGTESFIPTELLPKTLPTGNQAALSIGLANLLDLEVGDEFEVDFDGAAHRFVLYEIVPINYNCCYYDADFTGQSHELFGLQLKDASDLAACERIFALLDADGAVCIEAEAIFGSVPQTLGGHLELLRYAVIAAILLTLLGVCNLFLQQLRARRHEREILLQCGMTRGAMWAMYLIEALFVLVLALIPALLGGGLFCLLIDRGMRSFGMLLFV